MAYIWGLITGAYIRGYISGGLYPGIYPGAYIRGAYIWEPMPGQISGEHIYRKLYLEDLYPVAYIRGLISEGFYIREAYNRGLYPRLIYLSIGSLRQPLTKSLEKDCMFPS